MLNQFSRTQLLLGRAGMERLFHAHVAAFGIGGVGGYTVVALARSGVGTLDLIDDDQVCLTNLNRQIFATRKTVGQYKVDVAEERIKEIDLSTVAHTYKMFYASQTQKARHQKAEGGLFQRAAHDTSGRYAHQLPRPLPLPAGPGAQVNAAATGPR